MNINFKIQVGDDIDTAKDLSRLSQSSRLPNLPLDDRLQRHLFLDLAIETLIENSLEIVMCGL